MTQEEVADHLSVNRSTYTYYETGKSIPRLISLYKLSMLHHVTIDEILTTKIK